MVNVVCVKQGMFYGPEYVNRLFNMFHRNATTEFRFVCFTDRRDGINGHIECRPLPYHLKGWWCKIPLFAPPACIEDDQIVCIDLDVVITGNIDWLLNWRGDFGTLSYWFDSNGDAMKKYYNGSLWSLKPGYGAHVWNNFASRGFEVMKTYYSDQEYISEQLPGATIFQQLYPNRVKGFNTHYWNLPVEDRPDGENTLWIFHGFPKNGEVCKQVPFVKEHWQ